MTIHNVDPREGQVIDVRQRFNAVWTEALHEFERTMREEVIPEIEHVMRMRAERAQESRKWIVD